MELGWHYHNLAERLAQLTQNQEDMAHVHPQEGADEELLYDSDSESDTSSGAYSDDLPRYSADTLTFQEDDTTRSGRNKQSKGSKASENVFEVGPTEKAKAVFRHAGVHTDESMVLVSEEAQRPMLSVRANTQFGQASLFLCVFCGVFVFLGGVRVCMDNT